MSSPSLILEKCGAVAWLIHNRVSAMNAVNFDMIDLYSEYLREIEQNQDIRVVVVTGNGLAFCAGADLKEALESQTSEPGNRDFLDAFKEEVFDRLRSLNKPVIAALNGLTMAGGLEIAMCADIVTAAQDAKIADAHANYGVYPGGGGAAILPRIVPQNVANYLLLTGNSLSAEEMKTYGFVNEIFSSESLREETQKLAEVIAEKSPIALARMKQVVRHSLDKSAQDALDQEQVHLRRHQRSYDMQEGLRAFNEKRKPEFKGY